MTSSHEPDPQFVESLAWELRTAVRRQGALNGMPRRPSPGLLRAVRRSLLLILVSMCIGGAATYAVTHSRASRDAALLIARADALVQLATVRLDYVQQEQDHRRVLIDNGMIPERELPHLDMQLLAAQVEVSSRRLDLEETRLTGREPSEALYAPLVDGRDFVSERLMLQRRVLLARLAVAQGQAERAGLMPEEAAAAAHECATIETAVAEIDRRLALRQSFLDGERTPAEVQFEEMKSAAEASRRTAGMHLQRVQQHYERIRALHERGLTSESDMRAVEMELRSAELGLKLADVELQILEESVTSDSAADTAAPRNRPAL